MSARLVPALIAGGLVLAACSGGGGASSAPQAAGSGAAGTATGVVVVALPQAGGSSNARKLAFVSSATAHAAVFVNFANTSSGSTTSCTSTSCTITWSANLPSFPATYNFAVELDDNTTNCSGKACVLAEGSYAYTLLPGSNGTLSPPLPVNGVAADANFSSVNIASNAASAVVSITDADGVVISNTGNSVYDNSPSTGVLAEIAAGASTNATLSDPSDNVFPQLWPNGYNSTLTAKCAAPYTSGTFQIAIVPGTPSGDITANELSGLNLSYPGNSITTTGYTYNCDASGNITVSASGSVQIATAPLLAAFTISPTSLSLLAAGATATATINDPSSYSGSYYVSSSAPNVASATVNGKTITVTAAGAGTATIMATDTNGRSASVSVQVTTTSFIGQ